MWKCGLASRNLSSQYDILSGNACAGCRRVPRPTARRLLTAEPPSKKSSDQEGGVKDALKVPRSNEAEYDTDGDSQPP
jgi:hypothetical protein